MPSVFDYLDFRRYLRDFYAGKKARNPAFSYENFARKAGLKSKGMLHDILSGKRGLTRKTLFKLAEACGLQGLALAYFEILVAYGQAASAKEADWMLGQLRGLRREARLGLPHAPGDSALPALLVGHGQLGTAGRGRIFAGAEIQTV